MSTKPPPVRPVPATEPPTRVHDSKERPPPQAIDPKQAEHGAVKQNTRNTGYKQDR